MEFLDAMESQFPEMAEKKIIGKSFEGRPIKALRVGRGQAGNVAHNVFIEAGGPMLPPFKHPRFAAPVLMHAPITKGIHAREWISPAVAAYIIRELLEHSETRPQYTNELNIHFIPIVNPDGYEYSRREVFCVTSECFYGRCCAMKGPMLISTGTFLEKIKGDFAK